MVKQFDVQSFGPGFQPLLDVDRRRPLTGGTPNESLRQRLQEIARGAQWAHYSCWDRNMTNCCAAGLWLLHDFLDESHTISQGIDSTSGSFWHAIMHRREGDFSNAKYWFRRVGQHLIFPQLAERAAEIAKSRGEDRVASQLMKDGQWDPFAFVDACERAVRQGGEIAELCLDLQQAEWELLFEHCYRAAAHE